MTSRQSLSAPASSSSGLAARAERMIRPKGLPGQSDELPLGEVERSGDAEGYVKSVLDRGERLPRRHFGVTL